MRDQQTPNSYLNVSDIFTFFNFFFDIFGIFPPSSKGKPIHQMQKEKKYMALFIYCHAKYHSPNTCKQQI